MTTWRDVYDNPEGMACALEEIEKWLIARSYHPDASTVDAAAACIRDLAERIAELEARIAELEARPTPAPEGGEALREAAERMVNDLDRARRIGPMPSSAMLRVWASRLRKALTQNGGGEG